MSIKSTALYFQENFPNETFSEENSHHRTFLNREFSFYYEYLTWTDFLRQIEEYLVQEVKT